MERVCGLSTHQLLLGKGKELSDTEKFKIKEIVEGLRLYKPIQYLLGIADFYGMEFKVTPDVLLSLIHIYNCHSKKLLMRFSPPVRIKRSGSGIFLVVKWSETIASVISLGFIFCSKTSWASCLAALVISHREE